MADEQDQEQAAMVARMDSLSSMVAELGDDLRTLPSMGDLSNRIRGTLKYPDLLAAWRNDWLSREQIESKARDATRKWAELKLDFGDTVPPGGDADGDGDRDLEDVEADVERYLDELDEDRGIEGLFCEAIAWAELFGGALMVLGIDDGGDLAEPLDETRIRGIRWIFLAEAFNAPVAEYELGADAGRRYGKPKIYTAANFETRQTVRVHASRTIRFPGPMTPREHVLQNGGWQDSALQATAEAIRDYHAGQAGATNALRKFSIDLFKQKGLAQAAAAPGGADKLRARARALKAGIQLGGVAMVDADLESYEVTGRPVGGMAELIDRKNRNVSGAINVPETKIFGQAAGTVRAGAESDDATYCADVASLQKRLLVRQLKRLVQLACLSQDGPTGGVLPRSIKVCPRPLEEPSAKDKAEVFKLRAEALKTLVDAQIIDALEARAEFAGGDHGVELDADVGEAMAAIAAASREAPEPTPELAPPAPAAPGATVPPPQPPAS